MALIAVGCSEPIPARRLQTSSTQASSIGAMNVVSIAKQEAANRDGWAEPLDVHIRRVEGGWIARVWQVPKTPGVFADVRISSSGKMLAYQKGW